MFPPSPRRPPSKAVPKAVVHARIRGSLLEFIDRYEVSSLFFIVFVDKKGLSGERKKEKTQGT